MKLDKAQIEHIAKLARLKLAEDEAEKFATQLSDILGYVEVLDEVDTENVEITAQVTGLKNSTREDQPTDKKDPTREELLGCSPNPVEMNQIKVHSSI